MTTEFMTTDSVTTHRAQAIVQVGCVVVTVSDTRTRETDQGGDLVAQMLQVAGHVVLARELVRDEPTQIEATVRSWCQNESAQALLLTGGTGVSSRDHTFDTIRKLVESEIPGYGELLRMLSYAEIGPAALLSRAMAGILARKLIVTMPGSPAGIRLAMQKLILPELGHLTAELKK